MNPAVFRLFAASAALTAGLLGILAIQRAGLANPFELRIFPHLVLFQDYYAAFPLLAALAIALLAPVRELGEQAAKACDRYPGVAAALTTVTLALGAREVYRLHPLSMDEYTMMFQSQVFAEGRLTGLFPPELVNWLVPPGIQGKFFKVDAASGAVASAYWPGFSLLLAPFTWAGVPWLLNPIIGGASVLVMHAIARRLMPGTAAAGYVVLFTVSSSAFVVNALSYYAMPAHLLANALFVLLLLRPTPSRTVLAGFVGSIALVLHNPVPHLFFCLPWIAWLWFQPGRWRLLAALFAGYLPLCVVLGFGWALYVDQLRHAAAAAAPAPGGPLEVLKARLGTIAEWYYKPSVTMHVQAFAKLWIWAAPALIALAAMGAWRIRGERGPWLPLLGSALLTYVGYLCIPFDQGHGWGYRYFHSAWLAVPLLAAAALGFAGKAGAQTSGDPAQLRGYAAGCAVIGLAIVTSLQCLQVRHFITRQLAMVPHALPASARVVIFDPYNGYYLWDVVQNDPYLRNPVLRLSSRRAEVDAAMMARVFPEFVILDQRPHYTAWGPRP